MRVFILGGTGSLGAAVTRHLVEIGHHVTGLARSDGAAQMLTDLGAKVLRGDITKPMAWAPQLLECDALIQLAATFDAQMAKADRSVIQTILNAAPHRSTPLRVLYTGGCWLYGETGNQLACEQRALNPIAPFAFMRDHAAQLTSAPGLSVAVIHPALVYHRAGQGGSGAFDRFITAAQTQDPIEIWGSVNTRWPLVERKDLACAYGLLLDRPDLTGAFNVAAQAGVPVRDILADISAAFGHDGSYVVRSPDYVKRTYGPIAEGPMLDQQMSADKIRAATGWQPEIIDFRKR